MAVVRVLDSLEGKGEIILGEASWTILVYDLETTCSHPFTLFVNFYNFYQEF